MPAQMSLAPASDSFAASITGADVIALSDELVAETRRAFLDHHVLVFRDQHLDAEQMYNLAHVFGEVEQHAVAGAHGDKWSAVHKITNLDAAGNPVEKPFFSSTYFWHTDKSFLPEPALLTMLHAVELPPKGGDT